MKKKFTVVIYGKKYFWFIFGFLSLLLFPLTAEDIWIDRGVYNNPIFARAYFYECVGDYNNALEEYQHITEQYPGTEYDDAARLAKIDIYGYNPNFQDIERYKGELRSLRDNFLYTRYWLIARYSLLNLEHNYPTYDEHLSAINDLIVEMGGKSVYAIFAKKSKDDSFDPSLIAPQYRNVLAELYTIIGGGYEEIKKEPEKELKLEFFVRENFPQYTRIDFVYNQSWKTINNHNITNFSAYQSDPPPPLLRIVTPAQGAKVRDEQPRIEFELKSGDVVGPRIDLTTLQFSLNGVDLTEKLKIKSTLDTSGKPMAPFETLNIYYLPPQPLEPGTYQVKVRVMDYEKKLRQRSWSFQIL